MWEGRNRAPVPRMLRLIRLPGSRWQSPACTETRWEAGIRLLLLRAIRYARRLGVFLHASACGQAPDPASSSFSALIRYSDAGSSNPSRLTTFFQRSPFFLFSRAATVFCMSQFPTHQGLTESPSGPIMNICQNFLRCKATHIVFVKMPKMLNMLHSCIAWHNINGNVRSTVTERFRGLTRTHNWSTRYAMKCYRIWSDYVNRTQWQVHWTRISVLHVSNRKLSRQTHPSKCCLMRNNRSTDKKLTVRRQTTLTDWEGRLRIGNRSLYNSNISQ